MNRRVACLLAICAATACGGNPPASPSDVGCSTASLRGPFGTQRNGQAAAGNAFTAVGLATFDGLGHVVEQMTVSNNGVFNTISSVASYAMAPDCTGVQTD